MPSSGGQKSALNRKSTRLNSSHGRISYAVFCLKKKKKSRPQTRMQEGRAHEHLAEPVIYRPLLRYCASLRTDLIFYLAFFLAQEGEGRPPAQRVQNAEGPGVRYLIR